MVLLMPHMTLRMLPVEKAALLPGPFCQGPRLTWCSPWAPNNRACRYIGYAAAQILPTSNGGSCFDLIPRFVSVVLSVHQHRAGREQGAHHQEGLHNPDRVQPALHLQYEQDEQNSKQIINWKNLCLSSSSLHLSLLVLPLMLLFLIFSLCSPLPFSRPSSRSSFTSIFELCDRCGKAFEKGEEFREHKKRTPSSLQAF